LSDIGFEVQQASDAAAALRTVITARRPFNVVVLDLRLPDMNDLSLLGTLRQLLPRAALILMTAFGTAEIIKEAQALGATVIDLVPDFVVRLTTPPLNRPNSAAGLLLSILNSWMASMIG
jgi:DNA-binding NarL/FixJ family response regulator